MTTFSERASSPPPVKPILEYWGDLCPALLEFLQEQPTRQATTEEAYRTLHSRFTLSGKWLAPVESSGGEPYFENRVRFAREYLCEHGLIHRGGKRGVWTLTPKGRRTPPEECPTPRESIKSKTGFTLDQIATLLQRLYRYDPEEYQRLVTKLGL